MFKLENVNKVVKNFSYLTIGSFLSQIFSIITIIKVSKIFLPEEYGLYTFIFAQSLLINTIGDMGMRNVMVRAISRDYFRTNDLIVNGIKLRITVSILLMIIYIIYNYFLGSLNNFQIVILFAFTMTGIISNLFENAFIGQQKMFIPSLINVIFNLFGAIVVFVLPIKYFTVMFLLNIQLLIGVIKSSLLYIIMYKKGILIGNIANFNQSSRTILNESWPYFFQLLLMLPTIYLSNNFLDINSTKAEIGYFNLSQKLTGPINMVLNLAMMAIFPNFSALWINDTQKFYKIISIEFQKVIFIALILCFLFTIFAKSVVLMLFNDSYLPAVKVCQLQVWYVFLMGVNSFIGTVWGAENKEKLILKTSVINSLISTPMLYIGSMYGALGMAYAYVGSFVIFEIYLWQTFQKTLPIKVKNSKLVWIAAVSLFLISYFFIASY